MLLGCKGQFVHKIVEGTKPHSFRANRKDGRKWKVGDTIQFYENVRQPDMRKIRPDAVVKGVQDVKMILRINKSIDQYNFYLFIDRKNRKGFARHQIMEKDGFEEVIQFIRFFFPKEKFNKSGTWEGQLVHWTDLKY